MDKNKLHFRRQFLLCRDIIPPLSHWNVLPLANDLYLYSHPDLNISHHQHNGLKIVLVGYIFDAVNIEKNNDEILANIIERSETFDSFLEAIKQYSGRFVFIYMSGRLCNIVQDTRALREVYYCTSMNKIICGSQPNLIKEYSNPLLDITKNRAIHQFHDYDLKEMRLGRFWIGDETYFDGINHLLPNHYLDMNVLRAKRYWPREKLVINEFDEAVRRSCSFLQGILKAAGHRYNLMMAITSGTDSRTLLAASKEIANNIYYFINKHKSLDIKHPDIEIPSAILKNINLPFHIHYVEGEIDEEFREIFLNNTFLSTDLILPAIYNVYYKQHSQRLNILGVGENCRTFLGDEPRNLNGYYLAQAHKIKVSPYAAHQSQKWLDDTLPISRQYGINILALNMMEQYGGNWGVVGNSESDIAIEEFDPFNSHYLYETMLGIDKKYAKDGGSIIQNEMIKHMWPELLEFPFNPPYKTRQHIQHILKKFGLYKHLKSLVNKINYIRFKFKDKHQSSG